jgi:hypothetical protein
VTRRTDPYGIAMATVPEAYRGVYGAPRPELLADLALPPARLPARQGLRPLKCWRYIGVYGPELMLCLAAIRIGPARQAFWAVWDRTEARLRERTALGRGRVQLAPGRAQVHERDVMFELAWTEQAGIETVCPSGESYAWTRKQGGVPVRGRALLDGRPYEISGAAVIDDTAAYYERHTRWRWSAGVGETLDGRAAAWNLVAGVNDPAHSSERTVWIDGAPHEAPPCTFAADLSAVDELRFHAEATRERTDNLLVLRSRYRQPFGTFSGRLPGGVELAAGYGVMEEHDVWW